MQATHPTRTPVKLPQGATRPIESHATPGYPPLTLGDHHE